MARFLLVLPAVLALAAVGGALLIVPEGAHGEALVPQSARAGVALLLGLGVLAPVLGRAGRAQLLAELVGMAVFTVALTLALQPLGPHGLERVLVAGATLVLAWCLALPLRAMGWQALGRLAFLGGPALAMATPWMLPRAMTRVPDALVAWNPLVRLHRGEDWFHSPTLYPLIGEKLYRYPEPLEGAAWALALALLGVGLGLILARVRGKPLWRGPEAS